jgi:catechol 2,3-dioxygenase-like lactoylglutathione lyase family enzyme
MAARIEGRPVAFVSTADADRAIAFYGGTLGLDLVSRDDFGMFFALGTALLRVTPMPDFKAHPHPVLGWDVADIGAAATALKAAGVELTIYEGFGQDELGIWTAPDGKAKVAWFTDPDGNVLSLSETGTAG